MPKAQQSADSVAGLSAGTNNSELRLLQLELDATMSDNLATVTDCPSATMVWRTYVRNVARRYGVTIDGWPDHLIKPLSTFRAAAPSIHKAQEHLRMWRAGETHFRSLTVDELVAEEERWQQSRRVRTDAGSKRVVRQRGIPREARERVLMEAKSPPESLQQDIESESVRRSQLEELRRPRDVVEYLIGNPLYYT
ncbi:hypothetical protein FA95DRAFT_1613250 [Auriscalpium vulgare]|uniref:Uncharacterized protein n=1 Tax=Auriscalpium vulgare TaxID=40419 RepID=A0ACB8R4X7_9AGAM|nr:hypothetical protein FA95DRAFT_1613250 [Auriscalpium vulgare]